MSLVSRIATIDRKFAWSFLGFVLAVFFGGLTLYNEFIKNPNPQLTVFTLSDTNVLDVREDVPELKILYGDADIKGLGQTLSVLVLRVQNTGGAPILNTFYDDAAPPRLHVAVGKILKVEQLSASSKYLSDTARPTLVDGQTLQLQKVIMEPAENYVLKILLLRPARVPSPVSTTGKVAGMRELIPVEDSKPQPSFWSTAFSGSLAVQLTRAPTYFVGFILILFGVFGPLAFVSDRLQRKKRKSVVQQFRKHVGGSVSAAQEKILNAYLDYGIGLLARVKDALTAEDTLEALLHAIDNTDSKPFPFQVSGVDVRSLSQVNASSPEIILEHGGLPTRFFKELQIAKRSPEGTVVVDEDLKSFH